MGGHYGSIHFRTDDVPAVRTALEQVSRESKTKFLLAPLMAGWITAFPEKNGQDFRVSEKLAEKIQYPFLHCTVHDDDVFAYQFFEKGKLADQYNSCPEYFGGEPEPKGGDVSKLKAILPEAKQQAALKKILEADGYTFEQERFEQVAALLHLPNAVSAYEYLQDGERDGIKQWKEFIHIPDLTAERAAKRAAKAAAKAKMKQMAKDGLLVMETLGQKTEHQLFHTSPVWCIDPKTSEVLIVWNGSPMGLATPVRVFRINSRTGEKTDTNAELNGHVGCMTKNPINDLIAVNDVSGTQLLDLSDGKLVAEFPPVPDVKQVCFSKDGKTLFIHNDINSCV